MLSVQHFYCCSGKENFKQEKKKSNNLFREAVSPSYPAASLCNAASTAVRATPDYTFLCEPSVSYKHSHASSGGDLLTAGPNGQYFISFSFLK